MILVETVIGSSYLLKSEAEISLSPKRYFTRLPLTQAYFLKLLNCSVGLVCSAKEEVVTAFPPLHDGSCTFGCSPSRN